MGIELMGKMVMTCGYPLGQTPLVCTPALVVAPIDSSIMAKGEMYPGMSGGPVIDPTSRQVIGLNTGTYGDTKQPGTIIISPLMGILGAFGIEPKELV